MPIIIMGIGVVGAAIGIITGTVNTIKAVGYFIDESKKSDLAGLDLIPAFLDGYLIACGIIGLVGAALLIKYPRTGAGLLLGSAIAGFLPLFTIVNWFFAGALEIVAAIMAFSQISKMSRGQPQYNYYNNSNNYPPDNHYR